MEQKSLTESLQETIAVFEEARKPWTTPEVAERLDLGRRTVYARLEQLVEYGELETKKVGANARVWWRPQPTTAANSDNNSLAGQSGEITQWEQQFDSLVEATEEYAIFILDPDGYVQTWNPGAERIKGYAAEDILDTHFSRFYTEDDRQRGVPEKNLEAAAREGSVKDEGWRLREDGTRFWANVTITALQDDGDIVGFAKVTRDMTEQREQEQELREEKSFIESLLDTQQDLLYAYDRDGQFLRWNDRFREVSGYTDAEIEEMDPVDFIADRAADKTRAVIEQVVEYGKTMTVELPFVTTDGEEIPYEFTAGPLLDEDGNISGVTGIGRDISERKAKERRLERQRDELESELDDIFERISDGFYALNEDFQFTYVNDHAEELLELEESSILGQDIRKVLYLTDQFEAALHEALEADEEDPVRLVDYYELLDGWFENTIYPSESGVSVYFREITEQKRQEQELERTLDLFQKTERTADVGGWEVDPETMEVFWTDHLFDILEVPGDEEPPLDKALNIYHPDDRHIVEDAVEQALEAGESFDVEVRFCTPSGDVRWLHVQGVPETDGDEVVSLRGAAQDITERKERERELEQYQIITETASDIILSIDEQSQIQNVNPAVEEVLGYSPDELVGESLTKLMPDRLVDSHFEGIAEYLRAGERSLEWDQVELPGLAADGTEVPLSISFSEYERDGQRYFAGVIRDITERKQRELELERKERRFQTLIENFPNGVVAIVDDDLRYTAFGGTPEGETDLTRADLEGEYLHDILPAELADVVIPRYEAALDGHSSQFVDTVDGMVYQFHFLPVRDENCDVFAAMGMSQDITEQKEREQKLQDRICQQEVVTDLGTRALEDLELDTLMAEASEKVAEILDNDYCKVLELDTESEELLLRQGVGWKDGIVGEATVSAVENDSQASYTLATEEPIIVEDLTTESRFSGPELLRSHDVRSGISTIIGPADDPWGILGTHDTEAKEFTEQDATFVQAVANVLAAAIKRHRDEQELVYQREQLAALNSLNAVVRDITSAVIEQSTREEIEETVCERLAGADSYMFAWTGDVDTNTQTVNVRAEAGVDGYLDDITISVEPDDERSDGPTGRALRTGEVSVVNDTYDDSRHDPWREHIEEYGFSSSAAIPIVHEETVYGVLNVYADRTNAFVGQEREMIAQLGEIVGHAIASTERKQALMSDELVEVEFQIENVFSTFDVPDETDGRITLDHTVAVGDGEYLVYGTATQDAVESLNSLVEALPYWDAVTVLSEGDPASFELRLTDPPVLSVVASLGGYVDSAIIEDGDYRMTIHLAPTVDVRQVIETVKEAYPSGEMLRRQQITRVQDNPQPLREQLVEELTDRQRSALEAAYYAGFFEWPRDADGEEVADSLGIAPPTFHQHLRKAEQKVLDSVFSNLIHSTA